MRAQRLPAPSGRAGPGPRDPPYVFIGSIKDLTRKFADLRERFGISSFLIDDLDALAPVVENLAGR